MEIIRGRKNTFSRYLVKETGKCDVLVINDIEYLLERPVMEYLLYLMDNQMEEEDG